jgi:hypothetical protein
MSQTHLPERWIERVRANLEIPQDHQTYRFFEAWAVAEGGTARWNPLNTTNHVTSTAHGEWQGTDYNTIGVCNYNKAWQGILATVDTLEQTLFGDLLVDLRQAQANGTTAEQLVKQNSAAIKTWGTSPTLFLQVLETIK